MTTKKPIRERPMKGVELLEEAAWLLSMGMHPEMIATQLNVKPWSIPRLAHRYRHNGNLTPEQSETMEKVLTGFVDYHKSYLSKKVAIDSPRRYDEYAGLARTSLGRQHFGEGTSGVSKPKDR